MDQLRTQSKEQAFEIEKLRLHNRALEHQLTIYQEQIALLTRQSGTIVQKMVLPVALALPEAVKQDSSSVAKLVPPLIKIGIVDEKA
ncbi:unnamed protein product, partial [Mesorhabditis spiculigera]